MQTTTMLPLPAFNPHQTAVLNPGLSPRLLRYSEVLQLKTQRLSELSAREEATESGTILAILPLHAFTVAVSEKRKVIFDFALKPCA